jgi:hypothetical protein
MYKFASGVQNDEWVSGGWETFQHTTVLPQMNFLALHQGSDAHLNIPRLCSSFRWLLHGTNLLHFHIQTGVYITYFLRSS